MSASMSNAKKILFEAKAREFSIGSEIEQSQAFIGMLSDVHLNAPADFPKSEAHLKTMEENIQTMDAISKEYDDLEKSENALTETLQEISHYEAMAELAIKRVDFLAAKKDFVAAKQEIRSLLSLPLPSSEPLRIFDTVQQVGKWTLAFLYQKEGEWNLMLNKLPLSEEDINDFLSLAEELPLGVYGEHDKVVIQNEAASFCYVIAADRLSKSTPARELFDYVLPYIVDGQTRSKTCSIPNRRRFEKLMIKFISLFNNLSVDAFEKKRDYEESLYYFQHRALLKKEQISHPAFAASYDERDFNLRFIESEAVKKTSEEFAIDFKERVVSASEHKDNSIDVISNIMALPSLSNQKWNLAIQMIAGLPLEAKFQICSKSIAMGVSVAKQKILISLLSSDYTSLLDIDANAGLLLHFPDNVDPSLKKDAEGFVKGIKRSPYANKVALKSNNANLRSLFKLKGRPQGKPVKTTMVHPYSKARFFFDLIFSNVVSIAFICTIFGLLTYFFREDPLFDLFALIPYFLVLVAVYIPVYRFAGRDEQPASILRGFYAMAAWFFSIVALLFFIRPDWFPFLRGYMYFLLIAPCLTLFWGFFAITEKRKLESFLMFAPPLIIDLAATVFWIIAMANGVL